MRALGSVAVAWIICSAPVLCAEVEPVSYSHVLTSDRVNGVHADLELDIAPVELGPVEIRLRTPAYRFEVLEHELQLGATSEGLDAGRVTARFRGEATVVAELKIGDMTSDLDDEVVLPLQEVDLSGIVQVEREGEGFRVTTVEIPEYLEVAIESNLAGQLQLLCRGFAVLAMGNVDCAGVDMALSRVRLPLPDAGQVYTVSASDLTEHEREQVETYLRQRRR